MRSERQAGQRNADNREFSQDEQQVTGTFPYVPDTSPGHHSLVLAHYYSARFDRQADVAYRMLASELRRSPRPGEVEEDRHENGRDKSDSEGQQEPGWRTENRSSGYDERQERRGSERRPSAQLANRAEEERALRASRTFFVIVSVEGVHVA